jgi:hypothetical protein
MAVHFDQATHTYTDDAGKQYPSVTTILKAGGLYPNLSCVSAERREAALANGTRIHRVIELNNLKAINWRKLSPEAKQIRGAWREWCKASKFVPVHNDVPFIMNAAGYAGTPDCEGYFAPDTETTVLVDIKSGAAIPEFARFQLAAYAYGVAKGERNWTRIRRIGWRPRIGRTPPYTVKEFPVETITTDFAKFMQALRKMKENEN